MKLQTQPPQQTPAHTYTLTTRTRKQRHTHKDHDNKHDQDYKSYFGLKAAPPKRRTVRETPPLEKGRRETPASQEGQAASLFLPKNEGRDITTRRRSRKAAPLHGKRELGSPFLLGVAFGLPSRGWVLPFAKKGGRPRPQNGRRMMRATAARPTRRSEKSRTTYRINKAKMIQLSQ